MSYSISKEKLLLVEGKDEINVVEYFFMQLKISDIQVLDICGKTQFDSRLKILLRQPNFSQVQSIGIIRDADSNYESTDQSIKQVLDNNHLKIDSSQTKELHPKISIFIMPGSNKNGCIEELFLSSKANTPVMQCVMDYFSCVEKNVGIIPSEEKLSKAKASVLLASYPTDPDKRFGESVKAGIWEIQNPVFADFISFLKSI